jgi:hypothetical protein
LSNISVIDEKRFGNNLEGSDRGPIRALSRNFPEGLRKITKLLPRIGGGPAKIGTERLANTSLEHYRYANLFDTNWEDEGKRAVII